QSNVVRRTFQSSLSSGVGARQPPSTYKCNQDIARTYRIRKDPDKIIARVDMSNIHKDGLRSEVFG
ncbi:MAG TPA: hypothetical protein VFI76_03195, partial [Terrimicrobiaceae bacterium]|nr:hypothetical protein [Terrimicrobiaceae bacterium]